ncbi:hypothetical protein F4775DRAFT_572249 [Biscogniauxia sp. FL1348]|nr:hypothetical protein F4775DRAFT_572249 [Biscogniauxia sp. FL1348]
MAPIQNVFSIIPNAPCANPADSRPSKRPMTTKQAKKAYREANKGPKLSKAERRRQELFEQDRIRKELEKERNQARARAARDKKKEKEEQERAERKKKGLPLVDVRASQDTIARFIRTTAKTKKPEKPENQEDVPKLPTLSAEREDDASSTCSSSTAEERPEPPAKRQRLGCPIQDKGVKGPLPVSLSSSASSSSAPRSQRRTSGVIKPSPPSLPSINAKQARGRGPENSPAVKGIAKQFVEKAEVVTSTSNLHEEQKVDKHEEAERPKAYIPPVDPPQPKPLEPSSSHVEAKKALARAQPRAQPAVKGYKARPIPTPQPLRDISTEEINARNVKTPEEPTVLPRKPDITSQSAINPLTEIPPKSRTISAPTPQAFRHPKASMLPPPIPPKFKSPKPTPAGGSRTPQFLRPISKPQTTTESAQHSTALRGQDELPPSSTQLFMFNHLDDYFPSPSQEVRELFDEPKTSSARNFGQTKSSHPRAAVPPLAQQLSTHPTHQISTPTIGPKQPATLIAQVPGRKYQARGPRLSDLSHKPPLATVTKPPSNPDIFDIPFFSTQDICLSSQDMKDIEDGSSSSLPKGKTTSTPTLPRNVLRSSNTEPHTPTVCNGRPRPSAKPMRDLDPIYDDFSNLELLSKPKRDLNRLAPTRPSMKHTQPSQNTSTGDDKAPPSTKSHPTNSIRKPLSTPNQPGSLSNAEVSCLQMPAPSSGKVQSQPRSDCSAAAPRPSPKPFLTSGSREMRYKYAIERSKTSAWEDARARRRAQEELDQLQALEDARLLELLVDTGGDNCEPTDEGTRQADGRDTRPADPAKGSTQPRGQGKPPTAGASPPPAIPEPPKQRIITSDITSNDKRSEKPRPPNRRQQSSYEQMLELLKKAQSPRQQKQQQQQQPPKQQRQRDASPETDYEDAWDDDLCDIL